MQLAHTSLRIALAAAFVIGCAEQRPGGADDDLDPVDDNTSPVEIGAITNFQQGCDDRVVNLSAVVFVDGEISTDVECRFVLDDGQTLDGCQATHVFERAGRHVMQLIVHHVPSGTVAELQQEIITYDPFTLDVALDVPACGLTFTYTPVFAPDIDFLVSFVRPAENVLRREGTAGVVTVEVDAEGTYEVEVYAEDERVGPICSKTVTKQVTLVCCEH